MAQLSGPRRNRREHSRIKTKLFGRYMLADRREFQCAIIDVALGGDVAQFPALVLAMDFPLSAGFVERVRGGHRTRRSAAVAAAIRVLAVLAAAAAP